MIQTFISLLLLLATLVVSGQSPPTLLGHPAPPDLSERYSANPKFYEVMSAFPHTNSYVRYNFQEVRSAARNNTDMMVILGDHYRIGRSTTMDLRQALREYQRAAARGNAMAHHRIAYMYADGLGLPKDNAKILEHLRLGADGGDMLAQYDYALVYLNGKFREPRDLGKAYHYLVLASAQGHRLSTELLAMLAYHQGSPAAGIPYGFEKALELYRKAGDTDGERHLREATGSWGGLRYYLRTMPGFLPGVDHAPDPTLPDQGMMIIEQLRNVKHILGEEQVNRYISEITSNILYHSYFRAQGDREALIRFLILCQHPDGVFDPLASPYITAAARDFRLMVNFNDPASLELYLREFAQYPQKFTDRELKIIADRVYVALFFKENDARSMEMLIRYSTEQPWIIRHLTGRFIAYHENLLLEGVQDALVDDPYGSGGIIDRFFARYHDYDPSERDTLNGRILEALRLYALHPWLTERMIQRVPHHGGIPEGLRRFAGRLEQAAAMFRTDIDNYFAAPGHALFAADGSPFNRETVALITERVLKGTERRGAARLDDLCLQLRNDPRAVARALQEAMVTYAPEMRVAANRERWHRLYAETLSTLIRAVKITGFDPNGVPVKPETAGNTHLLRSACPSRTTGNYTAIRIDNEVFDTLLFTIYNGTNSSVDLQVMLIPETHPLTGTAMKPLQLDNEPFLFSTTDTIPAGESRSLPIPVSHQTAESHWVPVLLIGSIPVIPFLQLAENY